MCSRVQIASEIGMWCFCMRTTNDVQRLLLYRQIRKRPFAAGCCWLWLGHVHCELLRLMRMYSLQFYVCTCFPLTLSKHSEFVFVVPANNYLL